METENANTAEKESAGTSTDVPAVPAAENAHETVPAPKKKRRWLKCVLLALAGILVLAVIVVAFFLGAVVRFCANNFGAKILGVDKCEVGAAKIYPFVGYVHFENIAIGKPVGEGYAFSRDLLSVESVDVDVAVFSLLSEKKVLEHFDVRGISACYEQPVYGASNVDAILKNVLGDAETEKSAPAAGTPESETQSESGEPKQIFLGAQYFVLDNVNVSAVVRGVPIAFPSISANYPEGLGMEKNLSPTEFGMRVAGDFVNFVETFRNSFVGDAAGAVVSGVSDAATFTGDAAMSAAGTVSDAAQSAAGTVSDTAKSAADAVSGAADSVMEIFSSKKEEKKDK